MDANPKKPSKPRLVLITPPVQDSGSFAREVGLACRNADIAAVILRLAPGDDATQIKRIRDVVVAMPDKGPAVMIDGHVHLLNKTAADGVHLPGSRMQALAPAILREDRMVGAGALKSRHDAMIAGESGA
jgi:thiamine-phosphate pyrophosphorylase